jgi:hypothetical protein
MKTLESHTRGVGGGPATRSITRRDIKKMTRRELVEWTEFRGGAAYDYESTKELREAALSDYDGE